MNICTNHGSREAINVLNWVCWILGRKVSRTLKKVLHHLLLNYIATYETFAWWIRDYLLTKLPWITGSAVYFPIHPPHLHLSVYESFLCWVKIHLFLESMLRQHFLSLCISAVYTSCVLFLTSHVFLSKCWSFCLYCSANSTLSTVHSNCHVTKAHFVPWSSLSLTFFDFHSVTFSPTFWLLFFTGSNSFLLLVFLSLSSSYLHFSVNILCLDGVIPSCFLGLP